METTGPARAHPHALSRATTPPSPLEPQRSTDGGSGVSEAGGTEQRVRADDGAKAWRVSLQINTPSARRLHFWRLPDGGVELSRVGVHDDLTIT